MNYNKLVALLNEKFDHLPDPLHEPIQMAYIMKLVRHYYSEEYQKIEQDNDE